MDRREFIGGVTLFSLMRGGVFPTLRSDLSAPLNVDWRMPWTPITLDNNGPYPFAIGTGQTFFNVSGQLARDLGLKADEGPFDGVTPDGKVSLDVFRASRLTLGDAYSIKDVEFIARPPLDTAPFKGVLPFITEVATVLDFEERRMVLLRGKPKPPDGASSLQLVKPNAWAFIPVVKAELDGRPLTLTIDTNAEPAIVLDPAGVERLGLWDAYHPSIEGLADSGELKPLQSRLIRAKHFRMGEYNFASPVVHMMRSSEEQQDPYRAADGVIGMELLRRFQITFDPYKEVVWLKPNSRLAEPFAYDRSGFDTAFNNGRQTVAALLTGGPAEKAGMMVGDVLPMERFDAPRLDFSGPPGSVLEFEVQRAGQSQRIRLVLEELI